MWVEAEKQDDGGKAMRRASDSATEDDIRLATCRDLWMQGASPKEIAQAMGESVEDIYLLLKEAQKAIVAKGKG